MEPEDELYYLNGIFPKEREYPLTVNEELLHAGFLPAESKCLKRNGTDPLRKSN
jgi:hypothetical protein